MDNSSEAVSGVVVALYETRRVAIRDSLAEALSGVIYGCSRDWSAWSYGTMSEEDFYPAWEDEEVLDGLVTEALAAADKALIIETADELNALPEGSMGVDDAGDSFYLGEYGASLVGYDPCVAPYPKLPVKIHYLASEK